MKTIQYMYNCCHKYQTYHEVNWQIGFRFYAARLTFSG
jgi:hypothetical protein